MTMTEILEVAAAVVGSLGGGALLVVGVSSWLGKVWAARILEADRQRYQSSLAEIKSELAASRELRATLFNTLHAKRAEFVAELYSQMFDLYRGVRLVLHRYDFREIRENHAKKGGSPVSRGLTPEEQEDTESLRAATGQFLAFFKRHRLYFPASICEEIDRFATLATYLAINYENVVYKDSEGNLFVNQAVKETWDRASEVIPHILESVESEFRAIVGGEFRPPGIASSEGDKGR